MPQLGETFPCHHAALHAISSGSSLTEQQQHSHLIPFSMSSSMQVYRLAGFRFTKVCLTPTLLRCLVVVTPMTGQARRTLPSTQVRAFVWQSAWLTVAWTVPRM